MSARRAHAAVPGRFWLDHPKELRSLRELSVLAESDERGRLDGRARALAHALAGLRQDYPEIYEKRYERDAEAAINDRDMSRFARVVLNFMEHIVLQGVTRKRREDRYEISQLRARVKADRFAEKWNQPCLDGLCTRARAKRLAAELGTVESIERRVRNMRDRGWHMGGASFSRKK